MNEYWAHKWRDFRHSPCLMRPVTALILTTLSLLMFLSLLFQFPGFLLGFLIAPLSRRSVWFVEFLYPSSIARWGHLFLLRLGARSRNASITVHVEDVSGKTGGYMLKSLPLHSRAIEQRIEVIQGRVYIHPLPQLLDNIGYLIVGLPTPNVSSPSFKNTPTMVDLPPIVAILIDCGEADSVKNQIQLIRKLHYPNYDLQVHLILSTHKHHDHTAGTATLVRDPKFNRHLKHVCGGVVENVPCCTFTVADGDMIPITPSHECKNELEHLIEIECISVPSHTRGSTVFALRNKVPFDWRKKSNSFSVRKYLFTGDAMFSGGGGVPFEADLEFPKDRNINKKTAYSLFRPGGASHSMERCFMEMLIRSSKVNSTGSSTSLNSMSDPTMYKAVNDEIMIFPGHEYTTSLLQRQLDANAVFPEPIGNNQWSKMVPSYFFEVASQFFVANHRRNLPKTLRLLTVPTTMDKELKINPTFRLLRKRGEQLISAIKVWYHETKSIAQFNRNKSSQSSMIATKNSRSKRSFNDLSPSNDKTPSSRSTWNQVYTDIQRPVFTTVYTSDLETIIEGLNAGTLDVKRAAYRLSQLPSKLDGPVAMRSPVPGTLPNDKLIFLGMLALSSLGSRPSAMTESDSRQMKLDAPVTSSDLLLISLNRLLNSLRLLGLLSSTEESLKEDDYIGVANNDTRQNRHDLVQMIHLLWKEARLLRSESHDEPVERKTKLEINNRQSYDSVDLEKRSTRNGDGNDDLLELGILKHCLYAIPFQQPRGAPMLCLPCGNDPKIPVSSSTDEKLNMKRSGGELISHDVSTCPICRGSVGCPECTMAEMESYEEDLLLVEDVSKNTEKKSLPNTKMSPPGPMPRVSPRVNDFDETVEVVVSNKQQKK